MTNVIYLSGRDQPSSLLVERDPLLRSKVAAHLRGTGLSVLEAVSGDEALRLLRSGRAIHLVFGDLRRDGPALLATLRSDFPRVKRLDYSAGGASGIPQSGTSGLGRFSDLNRLNTAIKTLVGGSADRN